jgi:hypothetical protein
MPCGSAGPAGPAGPRDSSPGLKSIARNEPSRTLAEVTASSLIFARGTAFDLSSRAPTLFLGIDSAYAPSPSATNSASNATVLANIR